MIELLDAMLTAAEIDSWAKREPRRAQVILPELLIRLILCTSDDIEDYNFPIDKAIQYAGYDGVLTSGEKTAYFPEGKSVWEFGTNEDSLTKFRDDIKKRSENPLGVTVESTTFIFATLKIWNHKTSIEEVINESKKLYDWEDIRIIDASQISLWLRSHTAVAVWFANVMGKSVRGVRTVEDYWEDYAETTSPKLSKEFFLIGRETQNETLIEWIAEKSGTHAVVAESKMETILFVSACLLTNTKEPTENMPKALVIEGVEQWEELVIGDEKDTIFIPVFNFTEDIRCPTSMRVILPMSMYTPASKITRNIERVTLEKRSKETYHKALESLGYTADDFSKIDTETKRRFLPLYRKITTVITRRQPPWLSLGNIEDLIPAFLVGGWNGDRPGDVAAIQKISGENYDTYIQKISKWLTVEDAPIFKVFNTYQIVSVQDMWDFMYEMLSDVQIKRLEQCVYSAFSEKDTTFELPEDKWFMSSVYGKGPRCSGLLREGLIISLILLAEQENRENNCNLTSPPQYVNHIVKTVLAPIQTWQQWNTIVPSLPLLTEASPVAVLDKLEAEIGLDESEIWHLFKPSKDIMFGGTYYTHILWALENMVWFKASAVRAIRLLANISEKKLEYTISNSPNDSLSKIFCIWYPQSCLSCSERIQMMKNLGDAYPETMWQLMENLLPDGGSVCATLSKPRFRCAETVGEEGVTYAEYKQALDALACMALHSANSVSRWMLIIQKAKIFFGYNPSWPDFLLKFGKENATPNEVKSICDKLRAEISRHRKFCNSNWALPEKSLHKLEQVFIQLLPDDIDQYTYLFKYHPDLLDPVPYDQEQDSYESNRKRIHQKRLDAIRTILDRFGVDELINFAKDAEEVDELAEVFTKEILNGSYEFELILRVKSLNASLYSALLYNLYHINGLETLLSALDNDMLTPEEKADMLCRGPQESSIWDNLDAVGEGVSKYYWEHISEYQLYDRNHGCNDFALSQLLKYGRPFSAARIILISKYSNSAVIVETLKKCCELQTHKEANGATIESLSQHDVLELFGMIYSDQNVDLETLVQLEIAYLPYFRHEFCPKGIAKYLHQNPTEYVDLIAQNYKSDAGTEGTISKRTPEQRKIAYDIVDMFTIIPGCNGDKVDRNELLQWVNSAETYAANIGYRNSFMCCLGHLLSYSPVGEDGIFPHEAVRDCIEKLYNEKLVNSFVVGKENQRGVYWGTGGLAEKEIADKYKSNADALRIMYPQTAAVLDKLSESYRAESRYEQKQELLDYRG